LANLNLPQVSNWEAFGVEWEAVSELIGRIYECSLDPTLWDDTLASIIATFSPKLWDVAMLIWESASPPGGRFVAAVGVNPAIRDIYLAVYAGRNPWSDVVLRQRMGRVIDVAELVPPEQFRQTSIYQQFFHTWEIDRALAIVLDRRGNEKLGLFMPGIAGDPVDGLKRGLRLLAPHIQRAVRIRDHLGAANLRAAAAEAALDKASSAVLTLDGDFNIIHANTLAKALESRGLFQAGSGRIQFHDRAARVALEGLRSAAGSSSVAFTAEGHDGLRINALAAKVGKAGGGHGLNDAAFIVCLDLGDRAPLIEIDALRAWFGFTPAEGRLALALAGGVALQDYTRRRNVSVAAGRYLLKSIFRKAEVSSQAQLVARLRSLPM